MTKEELKEYECGEGDLTPKAVQELVDEVRRLEGKHEEGARCEQHGVLLHDNCCCGAPQCCWICCREATLEQRIHEREQLADELAVALRGLWNPQRECMVDTCSSCKVATAALARHAEMKQGGGAKDGATEGHAADNIDIRPPMR